MEKPYGTEFLISRSEARFVIFSLFSVWFRKVFSLWKEPYPSSFSDVCSTYRKEFPDFPFQTAFVAHPYSESFAQDLKRFKYRAERSALEEFDQSLRTLARICRSVVPKKALVAYPPSPFSRTLFRGYDHTALLAERFARYSDLPAVRILKTPWIRSRQAWMDVSERVSNVSNKFFLPSWSEKYQGLPVVFFDDVLSSGATAFECAKVLHQNGNREIYGFFLSSPSCISGERR